MTTRPPAYEPEEYPRCEKCGRLALHSRATMCSVCLANTTLKEPPPSPLGAHTANEFTVAKKP